MAGKLTVFGFFGILALIVIVYILLCAIGTYKSKRFFRKKFWILPLILVATFYGMKTMLTISARMSEEECKQMVEEGIDVYMRDFDERYGSQGISYEIEYVEMDIDPPTFSWAEFYLFEPGWINTKVKLTVDAPVAYQYMKKDPESYTEDDWYGLDLLRRDLFAGEVEREGSPIWGPNVSSSAVFVDSEGNVYDLGITDSFCGIYYSAILKNNEPIFEFECGEYSPPSSNDSGNGSGSSNGKCSWCNGTGSVRYNYGSSDLEAILSGHDPYTYGRCGSCGGTGRAK